MYVCNTIFKDVRYSKLCLASPISSPLAHTLYHSPVLGDQRLFMHRFNISTIIHVTLTTFPKCSAPLSSCIRWGMWDVLTAFHAITPSNSWNMFKGLMTTSTLLSSPISYFMRIARPSMVTTTEYIKVTSRNRGSVSALSAGAFITTS